MASFTYTAIDETGQPTSGRLQAEGRAAALAQLTGRNLVPAELVEIDDGGGVGAAMSLHKTAGKRGGRVSRSNVEFFTRELANLLAAGVPLSRALYLLSKQSSQPAARQQWASLHDEVVGGMSLADAMARFPQTFPTVYIAMVRAGETGGFLELVLSQIAEFRVREDELKGRVKAALIYPLVLASLAALVMVFLMFYFIPRFTLIFADFGETLPSLTRMIVGVSQFMLDYYWGLIIALVLLVLAVKRGFSSASGRRRFERWLLAVPGVGVVTARFALVRFCRMLGTLLDAGVPLLASLRVSREAVGNSILAEIVNQAMEEVRHGSALSASLAGSERLFPGSVVEMITVSEESGRLQQELLRIAGVYEAELDRRLRMLVALAEPALLFVMAIVIGTVVIGMLLPIFTLQEMIN